MAGMVYNTWTVNRHKELQHLRLDKIHDVTQIRNSENCYCMHSARIITQKYPFKTFKMNTFLQQGFPEFLEQCKDQRPQLFTYL